MFNNDFAVAVKVNGRILSEQGDIVKLPFGSEYTILLKNMKNVKAVANVTIDGRKVVANMIIPDNKSVEIERFVESMDSDSGFRLKFIEKTSDIEAFRGNRIDDGILRVEYRFEEPSYVQTYYEPVKFRGGYVNCGEDYNVYCNLSNVPLTSTSIQDKGITVEGNNSNQSFTYGNTRTLEPNSHVIILQLKGYTNQHQQIKEPFFVRQKVQCKYCGEKLENTQKFCGNCGARLNT